MNPSSEQWPISKLQDHPRQHELFGDLSDVELAMLMEALTANGLRHPIEILPDGTIIAGHQRVRAARMLGWTEIKVIVRQDLHDAGECAVVRHLISDNFYRRQLGPLQQARCAKELLSTIEGDQDYRSRHNLRGRLRDHLGQLLGRSGREVSRLLLALEAPLEVQLAVERGELPIVMAGKVARASPEMQKRIAKQIQAGKSAKIAIRSVLRYQAAVSLERRYSRLLAALACGAEYLHGQVEDLLFDAQGADARIAALTKGGDLLRSLIRAEKTNRRRQQVALHRKKRKWDKGPRHPKAR